MIVWGKFVTKEYGYETRPAGRGQKSGVA